MPLGRSSTVWKLKRNFSRFSASCSRLLSFSMASVKPAPRMPAGTATMAIPSRPTMQAMALPNGVMGGVSPKPPGSPMYCANDHATELKPSQYASGCASCSQKYSMIDNMNVTTIKNCIEISNSRRFSRTALTSRRHDFI